MRKYLFILLILFMVFVSHAQNLDKISRQCAPPNNKVFGVILVQGNGDIVYTPCPSRSNIFNGIVDFSNATVTGFSASTFLAGNGSAASPSYSFTNSPTTGFYRAAADQIGLSTGGVNRLTFDGADIFGGASGTSVFLALDSAANTFSANVNGGTTRLFMDGGTAAATLEAGTTLNLNALTWNAAATGVMSHTSTGNMFFRNSTTAGLTLATTGQAVLGDLSGGGGSNVTVNQASNIQMFGTTGITLGSTAQSLRIVQGSDTLQSTLSVWDMSAAGGAGFGVTNFLYFRTITAAGTTGNQTINLPVGTVNIAAGIATVTVTNSTVTANSIVFAIARTNDATCSVKNVVPAAGSFVVNMTAACTAETSVGFQVTN